MKNMLVESLRSMKESGATLSMILLYTFLAIVSAVWYYDVIPDAYADFIQGLFVNAAWTAIIFQIYIIIKIYKNDKYQIKLSRFFQLHSDNNKLTIFISNIQIQSNGSIALESVSPGFRGAAASNLEYQAAQMIGSLVSGREIIPVKDSGPQGVLGVLFPRFRRPSVNIRLSPLPPKVTPKEIETDLALIELDEAIRIEPCVHSSDFDNNNASLREIELFMPASIAGENPLSIAKLTIISSDTKMESSENYVKLVNLRPVPKKRYYPWMDIIHSENDKFWKDTLGSCGSVVVVGSDIYNSVARFYATKYYDTYKSNYKYFMICEGADDGKEVRDPDRRIVVRENDGLKDEIGKYPGQRMKSDQTWGEPAYIMRIKDLSSVEGRRKGVPTRSIFFCAGLNHMSTASAVMFLYREWERLSKEFGDRDFIVSLRCPYESDDSLVNIDDLGLAYSRDEFPARMGKE